MALANDIIFQNAVAITPSDTVNLTRAIAGIIATGAGNASVVTEGGQTVTIPVNSQQVIYLSITRVNATGTTATGIVGFY